MLLEPPVETVWLVAQAPMETTVCEPMAQLAWKELLLFEPLEQVV
jgi:hypothetical protein